MTIVNKDIGNGFIFRSVDSSKDFEHYFGGSKKYVQNTAECFLTGVIYNVFSSGAVGDPLPSLPYSWYIQDIARSGSDIYAVGTRFTGSSVSASYGDPIILKSTNDGDSWSVIDSSHSIAGQFTRVITNVALNTSGTIYVAESIQSGSENGSILVRSSSDGGSNWGVVYRRDDVLNTPWSLFPYRIHVALTVHPQEDIVAVSFRDPSVGTDVLILTSSQLGQSGSFLEAASFTPAGGISAGALLFSGTKLFVGGGDLFWHQTYPWIYSGSQYGGGDYVAVYEGNSSYDFGMIKKLYQTDHKLWALGSNDAAIVPRIMSSTAGHPSSWTDHAQARDLCEPYNSANGILSSSQGSYWIICGTDPRDGSKIIKSSDLGENWVQYQDYPKYFWRAITDTNQYGNLVIIGSSGGLGVIGKSYIQSLENPESSSLSVNTPAELFFGLNLYRDTFGLGELPKSGREKYYKEFVVSGTEGPRTALGAFSFTASFGSAFSFEEISFAGFSGSFYDLKNDFIVKAITTSTSSYSLNKKIPLDNLFYVRMRITSSAGSTVAITNPIFEYDQALTDEGVKFFRKLDNQNMKFSYINENIFTKVPSADFTVISGSVGPLTLATSIESSGKYLLQNVSEFPHYGGLFQMKNMVVGTQERGKIGRSDDYLIQVRRQGSVVRVLWPKQADQTIPVRGYSDLSIGNRAGKLSTTFEPGDFVDVSELDHLTIYCYLLKQVAGTLDNIDIRVERRPLRNSGFATDQTVEYSTSGSVTIGQLNDLVYRKQVDYSDLTETEISFPIDIPLVNVKDIRISAKHVTGQSDDLNKNFIAWGRFLSGSEHGAP